MKQLLSHIGSLYCSSTAALYEAQQILRLIEEKEQAYQIQGISGLKVSLIASSDIHFVTNLLALLQSNCSVLLLATGLSPLEKELLNQQFMSSYEIDGNSITDRAQRNKASRSEFCLTSSGTTGKPKIINCTLDDIKKKISFLSQKIPAPEIAVSASTLSLSFAHGIIGTLLFPFLTGNRVILIGSALKQLLNCTDLLNAHKVTFISATPHTYEIICRNPLDTVPSLKRIQTASAHFGPDLLGKLSHFAPQARLYNAYGLTEFFSWVSFQELAPHDRANLISLPDNSLLWDETMGVNQQEGLLYIPADATFPHWHGIKDTKELLGKEYLGTGDVFKHTPQGYQILSRKDDRISINAIKFYPQEIEQFINKYLSLGPCYFIHLAELKLNILLIEGKEDLALNEKIYDCCMQLPGIKRPQKIIYIENIPRTKRGKIARKELEALCSHMMK